MLKLLLQIMVCPVGGIYDECKAGFLNLAVTDSFQLDHSLLWGDVLYIGRCLMSSLFSILQMSVALLQLRQLECLQTLPHMPQRTGQDRSAPIENHCYRLLRKLELGMGG